MTDNPYESSKTAENQPLPPAGASGTLLRIVGILGILFILLALLAPFPFGRPGARKSAGRVQCGNNLRNIAFALLMYESEYESLPPAYTIDAAGKPLHSWRTLILPYIEQKALYKQIDLSKPWDDPANKKARDTVVRTYCCPSSDLHQGQTTYLVPVTLGSCFQATKSTPLTTITDGTSRTLLVIEVPDDHAVHWMSPQDIDDALLLKLSGAVESSHSSGAMAAFADGRTEFLRSDLKPETLRALISIAGNDNDQADF